ncbi:TrbC/VirB2 family protein [Candidatus Peribacteria bacterium]|nr:MAG: TrbC/VirB2 family protein [Candidatus Peribacteria bacterium]
MKTSLQSLTNKVAAASITSLVFVSSAFAQTGGDGFAGPDPNLPGLPDAGTDADGVRTIITDILTAVLNFLALIAVVVVVIAGIRLIVSQGEDEAKDKAKKTIFYALGGLVIVLFARVIVSLVTVYLAGQVEGN